MNTNLTKTKKEEDGDKAKSLSTKAPLTERIMKKAAAFVLAAGMIYGPSACSLIVPAHERNDHDSDTASETTDGSVEEDAAVSDGSVDEDAGFEPLCSGVFDEVVTEETFDKGTEREVGGYTITYVSPTVDGLTLDIDCGSDSAQITAGDDLTTLVEHTVEVPYDGKRIRITVHSRNTFNATMSVAVEPL